MTDIWDDNIRNTHDTGSLYAYAFGVCTGIFHNLSTSARTPEGAITMFNRLYSDVQARLRQLEQQAAALAVRERYVPGHKPFRPAEEPVTPIYDTLKNGGDQTDRPDPVIEP